LCDVAEMDQPALREARSHLERALADYAPQRDMDARRLSASLTRRRARTSCGGW
jgi:hypothetical protein